MAPCGILSWRSRDVQTRPPGLRNVSLGLPGIWSIGGPEDCSRASLWIMRGVPSISGGEPPKAKTLQKLPVRRPESASGFLASSCPGPAGTSGQGDTPTCRGRIARNPAPVFASARKDHRLDRILSETSTGYGPPAVPDTVRVAGRWRHVPFRASSIPRPPGRTCAIIT